MKKLGMYILICLLLVGGITPAQAATLTWDVTGTGTNPYTLTFTGEGIVHLESETALTFEDGMTGRDIDVAKTRSVTFSAATAPVVKIVSADQTKTVLIAFDREVTAEATPKEPVTEVPAEEPVEAGPPAEEPIKQAPVKEEPVEAPLEEAPVKAKQAPKKQAVATTGTITGLIWYDENEDGIREDEETRLNDVPIYLLNTDYDVVDEAYTQDGRYTFNNLPPGTYYIEVYGMDIGYYYTSPQHMGTDSTIDSDLDEEDLAEVRLKAGETVQIDAGLSGQDEEISEFANLLIVTNFLDENADKKPDDAEPTIPATYTVTDAITGNDVYTEQIGQEDALVMELPPGTYTVKTEVAAGYTVDALHRVPLDETSGFSELAEADLANGMEEDGAFEDAKTFFDGLERWTATEAITLTEDTFGYFLLAEIVKTEPVPTATPTPKPVQPPVEPVKAPVTEVAADVATSQPDGSTNQLPQAGEDKPFPYAATGAALAVAGLWFLLRRAG